MWAAREIVHLEIMRMPNRLCEVPLPLHIERMDDRRRAVAVCMCVKERHPRRVCFRLISTKTSAASAAVHKSNQTLENPNKSTTKPHPKPNISDYNI